LKYLPHLKEIPDFFKGDEVFEKAFEVARYAKLTRKERRRYELNIKRMRDTYAVLMGSYETGYNTGYDKGYDTGYDKGRIEAAQNMLKLLFSQKLGAMPPEIDEAIRGLNDVEQIPRILAQFASINDWQTLQNHLPKLHEGNRI
jgi:flagellar biosynthesis/type III secretory pathway protein FliH